MDPSNEDITAETKSAKAKDGVVLLQNSAQNNPNLNSTPDFKALNVNENKVETQTVNK